MKHFNVPAIDGIPGIMPGTVKVPTPPEFEEEEIESAQLKTVKTTTHAMGRTFLCTSVV